MGRSSLISKIDDYDSTLIGLAVVYSIITFNILYLRLLLNYGWQEAFGQLEQVHDAELCLYVNCSGSILSVSISDCTVLPAVCMHSS